MELITQYDWKGVHRLILLHLMFLCQKSIGASLNHNNGEQTVEATETIVAVAGISPALLNTAMSLFDRNKLNPNWQFASNLLLGGSGDKVLPLPFPTINAPTPLKPLLPLTVNGSMSSNQPLQYPPNQPSATQGGKDQAVNRPIPVSPLQPDNNVIHADEVPVLVTTQPENEVSPASANAATSPGIPIIEAEAAPTLGILSLEEDVNAPFVTPQEEEDVEMIEWSLSPLETITTTSGSTGQDSQGGHQTVGNQHLSMNLSGNQANFTTTSNVNIDVISQGSSNSNTYHHFGSRGGGSKHPGQTINGVTHYEVSFKNVENSQIQETDLLHV